jgi:hypothetical protein
MSNVSLEPIVQQLEMVEHSDAGSMVCLYLTHNEARALTELIRSKEPCNFDCIFD